jgi:hypothetical protein
LAARRPLQQGSSHETSNHGHWSGRLILLAACSPKPGEQRAEGQKNEPANIAQDVAGAATGVATGATGALNTDAFVKDARSLAGTRSRPASWR